MSAAYKEESRKNWYLAGDAKPSTEHLQLGCLQRIADATELMAKRYQDLLDERDSAQRSRDYWESEHARLLRRLNAAKGQITKLKRKAAGSTA